MRSASATGGMCTANADASIAGGDSDPDFGRFSGTDVSGSEAGGYSGP